MSLPPPPAPEEAQLQPPVQETAPVRRSVPVIPTLKEAWHLIRANPRTVLLPMAIITVPLALILASINATLFLTVWSDEQVENIATITRDSTRVVMFGVIVLVAVEILFAQVARAATIVAIAGIVRGKPPALTETLDPAFTRLGGLLVLMSIIIAIFGIAFVTVIGIVALPYVMLRLGLALDVFMIEGLGPWKAFRRSWDLMRGNVLRLLALIVLSVLCSMPIILMLSIAEAFIGGGRTAELLFLAVFATVQSAALVPVVGFLTACTTLYYFKTRAMHDAVSPA